MPTVSVVIPTFNRSLLLPRALKSVFAQSYRDYEVIVVDDGSTDDTCQILEPYMDRIRYFHQDNHGAASAQNLGILAARGIWVSILASDDAWLPTKLERQLEAVNALGQRHNGIGAVFTNCSFMGNPNLKQTAFEMAKFQPTDSCGIINNPIRYVLWGEPVIFVQSLMILRTVLADLGGFDESMIVSEDTEFITRLTAATTLAFVSEPLVRIDRSPSHRLIDLYHRRDDRAFRSRCHLYRKWLDAPFAAEPQVHDYVKNLLTDCYFNWIACQVNQERFRDAFKTARQMSKQTDTSMIRVLSTLGKRAMRKLWT